MRICLDLDGVISELKGKDEDYSNVLPRKGAVEKIKALKENGCYIIIQTARHMKTCEGNLGLVNARVTQKTLEWLEKHQIPYDEIYFGKPWANIYIDDNGYRFTDWDKIEEDGSNLPKHIESINKG